MRIISILVVLPLLWVMLVPQSVLAAEIADANETQIKFNIQENIKIPGGFAYDDSNRPLLTGNYKPVEPKEVHKVYRTSGSFVINASAYTAAADECGKSDGITASGKKVKENHTLACPPQFKFGTKIKIDGHGTYVCEDRGGAIKGNHFDIYMHTKKQAFAFGRKNLLAEVVQ